MDAIRTNVTEISQFARERKPTALGGVRPLDESRENSALGLSKALGDSLKSITTKLFGMAEKTSNQDTFRVCMEALELARDQGTALTNGFRERYLRHFNLAYRHDAHQDKPRGEEGKLGLMEADDLEESLAAETFANALYNTCGEELFGLDKRMGMLVNDPELRQGKNPLGPEVITDALMELLREQEISTKARLLLVSLLNKEMPERTRTVYEDINENLVRRGVLPAIRVGLRKAPARELELQSGQAVANDVFAALKQMITQAAGHSPAKVGALSITPPPMPGEPGFSDRFDKIASPSGKVDEGAAYATAFIQALNQLQRGQTTMASMPATGQTAISSGRLNVLNGLRDSGISSTMAPMDSMTLDIVAMMFDYILDDKRIPDAIKALIGRLQIPILKVAIIDKAFFSQRTHPARHLLDALAEAAIGWDPSEGHESGLYRKVEQLVQGILDRFEDRVEIFAEAVAELDAYLAEEKRIAETQISLRTRFINAQEQDVLARKAAHDELHALLVGQAVPEAIRAFLSEHWESLLTKLYRKAGMDSETWRGALGTATDLIWSVQPKTTAEFRGKLVQMLPGLLKRLDEGIRFMALPKETRDAFLANLIRMHAAAVKAGQPNDIEMANRAQTGAGTDTDAVDDMLDATQDFQSVPLSFGIEDADEADADSPPLNINMPDADPLLAFSVDDAPQHLKRGSWIEYRTGDGEAVRAKLSWISPQGGMYLFTNRLGQRAISIGAAGLSAKMRNGEVTLVDDVSLVDHAVDQLMDVLQRKAG